MFVSRPLNRGGITSSISGRAGIIHTCTSARHIAALVPMPLRRPSKTGSPGWSLPGRIDFTSPSCGTRASGLVSTRHFPSMSASTPFATTRGSRCNGDAHGSSQVSGSSSGISLRIPWAIPRNGIGRLPRTSNGQGPAGVKDLRHQSRLSVPLLSGSQQDELVAALAAGSAPEGDRWSGGTVAAWISQRLGQYVGRQLGWAYLRRLGARLRMPRPRHVQADPQAQADFKQHLRPLLRQVATAFPQASVELWAVDEHRIGLKPILRKVSTLAGQRPIAPLEQRYAWRYVVGFVHPTSGRTVWHLATTRDIRVFSVELDAFAQQAGASSIKQIVLVLDGAGWHESPKVRVPEHVHLLFLPPHSLELQPAEHLWPLTNTVLVNRHFMSIEELEDAQAERCVALRDRRDLVRSATRFSWWPLRIKKRQGLRTTSYDIDAHA